MDLGLNRILALNSAEELPPMPYVPLLRRTASWLSLPQFGSSPRPFKILSRLFKAFMFWLGAFSHQRFSVLESCKNDMFGSPLNGFGGNTRAGFALRLGSLKSLISEDSTSEKNLKATEKIF